MFILFSQEYRACSTIIYNNNHLQSKMILFRKEYKIFVVIYIKIENFSCKLNENMSNIWDVCCSQQDGVYCLIVMYIK